MNLTLNHAKKRCLCQKCAWPCKSGNGFLEKENTFAAAIKFPASVDGTKHEEKTC